ncbi:MAG: hypothetical protein ABR538_05295 [Candidatus Binatia bacterium]
MERTTRAIAGLVAAAFVLLAAPARAQRPVCADLAQGEAVQVACRPFTLFAVVRFLSDFTVDHLFKPSPPPVQRSVMEAVQVFGSKEIIDNPALKEFLSGLAPLRFTQLDRTTGAVLADFTKSPREFRATLEGTGAELALTLPAVAQGGYWRAPDVLQVAFWEKGRFGFSLTSKDRPAMAAEIGCLSLTPDGLLLRFEPASIPPLLVLFRECQE